MDYKYIGELIELKRMYKGLSDKELAEKTGVSIASIRKIREGRKTDNKELNRVIDYLGVVLF